MSGDLTHAQSDSVTNEFIDIIKSLTVNQISSTYADSIKELQNRLEHAIPTNFQENKFFAYSFVENLHQIIPIFDRILSNENANDKNFIQTQKFLEKVTSYFNGICLFDVFGILKSIQPLEIMFRKYIILLKETYFTTDNHKYDHLINCLIPIIAFSSAFIPLTEDNIPTNVLVYLLTYTKRYWKSKDHERPVQSILILIKVFSKKAALVPLLIRTEWPHACIQWLINKDTENSLRPSFVIDHHICIILQKLARHTLGVEILNQLNCLKALDESHEPMKKTHTTGENQCLEFLRCMIYALLMEANDIKQLSLLNDQQMCQALDDLVTHTIEASRNEYLFYQCFHIAEMLSVLSKLFVNDDMLIKCLNENDQLFDCFSQLLVHFTNLKDNTNHIHLPADDETLLTVTNLLWSISFHQAYHEKFQKNSLLMHTLTNLSTSSSLVFNKQTKCIPKDLCSLKKAAEGMLWNLKSSSKRLVAKLSNEKVEQKPLAMISYSHSDGSFCRELVERLSAHVPVWVDYKQAHDTVAHSDDLWEEIARAMEMATVIVLIVSKEYYDSKSCRQELSYASDTLKKRIVPIYAPNQQYRASGWLGIRIAGQKYIHFGRKLFADAIKELASIVLNDQKQIVISSPAPAPSSEPVPCTPTCEISSDKKNEFFTIKDWTTKDIRKWFEDNHIHEDLITLYADQFHTGTSLIVYARHLKLFYRNEYIRIFAKYYKTFHGKTLDTLNFITFVDALYRLRTEYDPNWNIEDSYEKRNNQQCSSKVKNLEEGMTWL